MEIWKGYDCGRQTWLHHQVTHYVIPFSSRFCVRFFENGCEPLALIAPEEVAMKTLQNFLQSLRRRPSTQQTNHKDSEQQADADVGFHLSSECSHNGRGRNVHEAWPLSEADYEQVEHLRDWDGRYEWELWRL